MIFVIETTGNVSGQDITRALALSGIDHVILNNQNDSDDNGCCPDCGSPYKDAHWTGCEYERVEPA